MTSTIKRIEANLALFRVQQRDLQQFHLAIEEREAKRKLDHEPADEPDRQLKEQVLARLATIEKMIAEAEAKLAKVGDAH